METFSFLLYYSLHPPNRNETPANISRRELSSLMLLAASSVSVVGLVFANNNSPTTDDANANINNDNSRLEILAGVSFRLGGCNE